MTAFSEDDVMAACGGTPRIQGGEKVLWFGSNPSAQAHTDAVTEPFNPDDKTPLIQGDRVVLYQYAKILNGGAFPAYSWQKTGSCVNSGMQNALITLMATIRALFGGQAAVVRPFTLPAYGASRKLAFGDDTPGEGSSGDAMAQAMTVLGSCEFNCPDAPGLPQAEEYPAAFCYSADTEMFYSAAHNCPAAVTAACKQHKLRFGVVKSLDQAETEIRRGRPITVAGDWGSTMAMSYRGTGDRRVLFGQYASTWQHQQSCHGVWHHPDFGRLWYIMNNWYMLQGGVAVPVHGTPATDEPPGGYWVDDSMMLHQIQYKWGELRSIFDFTGMDQGTLNTVAV